MSFLRPEARRALLRWREALAGVGLICLGAYWSVGIAHGLLVWIGAMLLMAGIAVFLAGVQRGRARTGGGGPGVVQIVERQIGYFGPVTGGVVDLDTVTMLRLDPTTHPRQWILTQDNGPALHIPVTAEGADLLFDVFASLPGLSPGRMTTALTQDGAVPVTLWQRPGATAPIARLH